MKIFLISALAAVAMTACAPGAQQTESANGMIYSKVDISQLQTCSALNSCPTGESCTSYDSSGNAYCYADGHENEVVGCTTGKLIIMTSFPGQVGCN